MERVASEEGVASVESGEPGPAGLRRALAVAVRRMGARAGFTLAQEGGGPVVVGAWPEHVERMSGGEDAHRHRLPSVAGETTWLVLEGGDPGSPWLTLDADLVRRIALNTLAAWSPWSSARADEALQRRLRFERLVLDVATRFAGVDADLIDLEVQLALGRIGQFVGADRSYLFRTSAGLMSNTHEWCAEGIEPQIEHLQDLPLEEFASVLEQMADGSPLHIPRVSELDHEHTREVLEMQGIQSLVLVPLSMGDELVGYMGFDAVRRERTWDEDGVELLRIVGSTLANSFQRIEAQMQASNAARAYGERLVREVLERTSELQESEARFRGLAETLVTPVAVFTEDRVRYANPAAVRLVGGKLEGRNVADLIEALAPNVTGLLDEVRTRQVQVRRSIRIDTPIGMRVLDLQVGLLGSGGEVLLTAIDVTEQRESAAEDHRILGMVDRRSQAVALSELASSLGHELNQPLMAVHAYCEGSLNMLESGASGEEVLEAMRGASEAAKHAGDIVRRLRSLFRRDAPSHKQIQLGALVLRVAQLFEGECGRAGVRLETKVLEEPPPVEADERQIEVVLLNLVRNAMRALEGAERKELTLGTCWTGPRQVAIYVKDTGRPVVPEAAGRMFDSFFTTRKDGSGMGLFISRTIAESHQGDLWYEVEEGGAKCFFLGLPATR